MSQTPTVSAIIPFYGDPADTLPLIEALESQTHPPHQIIVADDASPKPFPQRTSTTVVRQSANRGFGTTVNRGVAAAHGELLLILNSDLTIERTFIADLVAGAAAWQPAVISPQVHEHGALASTARRLPTVRATFFSWLTPLARLRGGDLWRRLVGHYDPRSLDRHGQEVDWVVGACMLIPRTAFEQAGGFDERFHMNSEEVDLQRRLTMAGVPSVVLPQVTVDHVGGGSSDPGRRRQWLVTGLFRYFDKWGGAQRLALPLLIASVLNLLWNAARRIRGVEVRPVTVFREELALITRGYRSRRRRAEGETT